jgi:hypothetical protein
MTKILLEVLGVCAFYASQRGWFGGRQHYLAFYVTPHAFGLLEVGGALGALSFTACDSESAALHELFA